jgi:hypothetical protein
MAIFAGIDLLGKYLAGDDGKPSGGVGKRFTAFVRSYFKPLGPNDDKVLYQLRNSLLHSFGLFSRTDSGSNFHFILTGQGGVPLLQNPKADFYQIDLIELHQSFENAVEQYRKDLDSDPKLQANFLKMFPNYGAIDIR